MQPTANRNKLWAVLAAVAVVIVVAVAAYAMNSSSNDVGTAESDASQPASFSQPADSDETANDTPVSGGSDSDEQPAATSEGFTIVFTNAGFAEQVYQVKPGATVTVRNASSRPLQFSSDDHPSHRDEPSLNTPTIRPGETTTFTAPSEPGEYGFHDHINARHTGALVVK